MKDLISSLMFLKCQEVEAFTGFWKYVTPEDYKGSVPYHYIKELVNEHGMVKDFIRLPDGTPVQMCRN